jgi:CheY-like chemotaxis protein
MVSHRVLLVDDEPSVVSTLKAILEYHGMQVETAISADAARRRLKFGSFDVVVTDMSMETEDAGYTVIDAAREGLCAANLRREANCAGRKGVV